MKALILLLSTIITNSGFSLSLEQLKTITSKMHAQYLPYIQQYNANLNVIIEWDSDKKGASAWRRTSTTWELTIYRGLVEDPLTTEDSLQFVLCHEMGHFFGGYPQFLFNIAASEGQADYFTTQSCLRMLWKDQIEINANYRINVNPSIQDKCDRVWLEENQQNLCYRIIQTAHDASIQYQTLLPEQETIPVSLDTNSERIVTSTSLYHSIAQCRLDTYVAGALCTTTFDLSYVPMNYLEAMENSCDPSFDIGLRPPCWFKHEDSPAP